jgi:hypothetical protein
MAVRGPTNIHDLRVLHDELVHGDGCDPEEDTSDNHGDNSRNPSQNAEIFLLEFRHVDL